MGAIAGAGSIPAPARRFPPPSDIEEANASCFLVKDNNGQALAYRLLRAGARPTHSGEHAHQRRSAAHCGELRQAAEVAKAMLSHRWYISSPAATFPPTRPARIYGNDKRPTTARAA